MLRNWINILLANLILTIMKMSTASIGDLSGDEMLQVISSIKKYNDLVAFCKTNVFIRGVCSDNGEAICMSFMTKKGYKHSPPGYTWCRLMRMIADVSPNNMHYTNKYSILSEAFKKLDVVDFLQFRRAFVKMHPGMLSKVRLSKRYKKEGFHGDGDVTRMIKGIVTLDMMVEVEALNNAFMSGNVEVGKEILEVVEMDEDIIFDVDIAITLKDIYVDVQGVDVQTDYFNYILRVVGHEKDSLLLMMNDRDFLLRYLRDNVKRAEYLDFIIEYLVEMAYYKTAYDILRKYCIDGTCRIRNETKQLISLHYMQHSTLVRQSENVFVRENWEICRRMQVLLENFT